MNQQVEHFDIIIIGGGIVGLATAYAMLSTHPQKKIVILEKESALGRHQSGHNSGVIHTGIYYKPGSLKAKNCTLGRVQLEAFCEDHSIAYERCGKVIVASSAAELPALHTIYERGKANGVACSLISPEELREREPHVKAVSAILVHEAGIVDYKAVCQQLGRLIEGSGGKLLMGRKVKSIQKNTHFMVSTDSGSYSGSYVVNCAGLYSDKVSRMLGNKPEAKIIPFRGEYYKLKRSASHLCKHLVYPVPDPSFPFLGVHFTRMINGDIECGPNAVLAFAREGYAKSQVNMVEFTESLTYPGFLKLAGKHWRTGLGEMWRSYNKNAFVKALQRLIPDVTSDDLVPAPAGVRAQAVSKDGHLVDDFVIADHAGAVDVLNAPSPAATSSLAIGSYIAARLAHQFKGN